MEWSELDGSIAGSNRRPRTHDVKKIGRGHSTLFAVALSLLRDPLSLSLYDHYESFVL
jgi:hypothetical protein